jgi:hypothetical protein
MSSKLLLILFGMILTLSAHEKKWVLDTYKEIRENQFYIDKNGKEILVYTIKYSCQFSHCELEVNGKNIGPDSIQQKKVNTKESLPTKSEESNRMKGMLAEHNKIRASKKLQALVWDSNLANYAQEWADTLQQKKCSPEFRPEPQRYGESIIMAMGYEMSPVELVTMWGREEKDFDTVTQTCAPGKVCKNYKQIISPVAQKLGCGVASCGEAEIWVCNYDPIPSK